MNSFYKLLISCSLLLIGTGCEKKTEPPKVLEQEKKPEPPASAKGITLQQAASAADVPTETANGEKIAVSFPDGFIVTQNEVLKRIQKLNSNIQSLPFSQVYNLVLFTVIQEHIGYTEAISSKIDQESSIAHEIKTITKALWRKTYIDQETEGKISDEDVRAKYEESIKNFKSEEEIELRTILAKDEEEANAILEELKQGESFDSVQTKYMTNKAFLEKKGILPYYFKKKDLPPEHADLIMKTPVGQVIPVAIAITGTKKAVFMVTNKRLSQPPSFEQRAPQLKMILMQTEGLRRVNELLFKHSVKILSPTGEVIPIKTIDERFEEIKNKKDKAKEPTEEEIKRENAINKLKEDSVVAEYDTSKKVHFRDISAFIQENPSMFRNLSTFEVYTTAIEEYLIDKFLAEVIEERKINEDEEAKKQIQTLTVALLSQHYWERAAKALLTDAELRKHFEKIISQIDPNEMETRLRVIPVETVEAGNQLLTKLKKGDLSFDAALDKYTKDEQFKKNKGDLGYIKKEQLIRLSSEVADAVKNAAKATYLAQPYTINGQIFVIRVDDKRKVELPKLAQVKEVLVSRLLPEYVLQALLNYLVKSNIHVFDFNGKPINVTNKNEIYKILNPQKGTSQRMAKSAG